MKITSYTVHNLMDKLIGEREYSIAEWEGARFEMLKKSAATDKGNLAEDMLASLLETMGYQEVVLDQSRRGHWDVRVANGGAEVLFEVKVATQDVHKAHQFNGIRRDTKYTHLFLLGVLPEELRYCIVAKRDLDDYTLVSMAKGSNAAFKLTRKSADLQLFDAFYQEATDLLGYPNDLP